MTPIGWGDCDFCRGDCLEEDIERHEVSPGVWKNACHECVRVLELREGK